MLGEHLRATQEALALQRLIGDLSPRPVAAEIVRQWLEEPLDDDGVALAEEVGEGALVADEDVGDEVRDDELDLGGGGRGMGDGALEDEPAEASDGLRVLCVEPRERLLGREV